MSTYEDLRQRYIKAQEELEEAQEDERRVEQRHSSVSGDGSIGNSIPFLHADHPEVQQAWERTKKAWESVVELQRQLRESLP